MAAVLNHGSPQEHSRIQERILQSNQRINERISSLETRLRSEISDVKLKIAESNERIALIHGRIAETKTETLKWTLGFMAAQTGLSFAAIKFSN